MRQTVVGVFARIVAKRRDFVGFGQRFIVAFCRADDLAVGACAVWLVLNEIISILENLNDIGVPMPPFLMPLVNRLKVQVDKKQAFSEVTHTDDAVTINASNINVDNFVDKNEQITE